MESESYRDLHVAFFPYMAFGHMIPMADMARLCARQGVKATLIVTPHNAPFFSKTIDRERQLGSEIFIRTINFPGVEVGLPEGCESFVNSPEIIPKFYHATTLLPERLDRVLRETRPDILVADIFFPWATKVAGKFGIPRVVFHVTGSYAISAFHCLNRYEPYKDVESDFEPFTLPGLPHHVQMTKLQLPPIDILKVVGRMIEADSSSHGVILHSFHGLEPGYPEYYSSMIGRPTWLIGPLSTLCNQATEDKAQRGQVTFGVEHECLRWLNSKEPSSVLYICFGSLSNFTNAQLLEMALAFEASGQNFLWVVKKEEKTGNESEKEWLPEGYEERVSGRGLIVRGWAPQVLILEHEAVGGFMFHCGWNSLLEGLTAGVTMITWPLFAENFTTEKLITEVLKIGVSLRAQEWSMGKRNLLVKKEDIEKAVTKLLIGEEAEEIKKRAQALKEMAWRAIEREGSSYGDLFALLDELRKMKPKENFYDLPRSPSKQAEVECPIQ